MPLAKKDTCGGKYCKDWEEEKGLKDWLQPVAGDEGKAACRFCKCEMHAHYSELQQHVATANHEMNAPAGSSTPLADIGPCVLKTSGTATAVCKRKQALDYKWKTISISSKTREEEKDEAMVGNGPGNLVEAFQFSTEPTLEDIRKLQSVFTAERGWGKYHQPRNLLLALVGEVGELAELFQWREEAPEGLPGWTALEREALSDELSDVLIYLVALADKCRVDLPSAALHKIEKNRLKYPAEQVYGSSKKYTEYQK